MHHMYKTDDDNSLPDHWRRAFKKCRAIHKPRGWKSILWTDESIRSFLSSKYNWFLPTYDSYPYWIQRADSARYFILYHYGGVYIDLDVVCIGSFEPIYKTMLSMNMSVILPKTKPIGYSNDVLFARKGSRYVEKVIDSLERYNKGYGSEYMTVMMSTGPLLLTSVVYHAPKDIQQEIGILAPEIYAPRKGYVPIPVFRHIQGNSWHGNDIKAVFWIQSQLLYLSLCLFVIFVFRLKVVFLRKQKRPS